MKVSVTPYRQTELTQRTRGQKSGTSRFPSSRLAKQTEQPGDGSLQIVHARRTSDRMPATFGAAASSQIQALSRFRLASSSQLSALSVKHRFRMCDRGRFSHKLNYLGADLVCNAVNDLVDRPLTWPVPDITRKTRGANHGAGWWGLWSGGISQGLRVL